MAFEGAKAMLGEAVVKQLLRYLTNKPEENLVKILQWGETLAREPMHKQYARSWINAMKDENNNWRKLAVRTLKQVSPLSAIKPASISSYTRLAGAHTRRQRGEGTVSIYAGQCDDPTGSATSGVKAAGR